MNEFFEFVTTSSSGIAKFGEVILSFGSPTNTAALYVEPSRIDEGSIEPKDAIQVWCVAQSGRFEVFRGLVSKLARDGAMVRIDAVTVGALASVDRAPVRSWANTTALAVLRDLVSASRLGIQEVSYPDELSDKFLHIWNSDGESVADEILELLARVGPSMVLHADAFGRVIIGTRDTVAMSVPPLVYPFDEAQGETDTEVTRFSLRHGAAGQLCLGADGAFVGTLAAVTHFIGPGQAYTDLILDDAPSPVLEAIVGASRASIPVEAPDEAEP